MLAQEPGSQESNQLEALAESSDTEPENDELEQQLNYLRRRPLAINAVTEEDLLALQLISPIQMQSFRQYRELFGPIRNRYELQAIPGWDILTIKRLIPFISFEETGLESRMVRKIFTKGQHQVIFRMGSTMERAKGYQPDSTGLTRYAGNRLRLFYRYTYQFKQQVWWGFTGEKDAGEKLGDFHSVHLFIRRAGWLKTICLGDFVLNAGQGLVLWQGLAFGKTSEVMSIYRQGNALQPYRSSGEWNFHRGLATQLQYRHWEATIFLSSRKLTANLVPDAEAPIGFTSVSTSGYHRTAGEIADRNQLILSSYGGMLQFVQKRWRVGLTVIRHQFGLPAVPTIRPDNRYSIHGRNWFNSGVQYSYTVRNIFFFGEAAACRSGNALIQGLVMSLHHKADLSVVYRNIAPGYQALNAASFTENSSVTNEKGLYTAIRFAPWPGWQVQVYADVFRFPWLRFRADAPGEGREYFLQVGWIKRKKWNSYLRFRSGDKPENLPGVFMQEPVPKIQQNLRLHVERLVNPSLQIACRIDQVWYQKGTVRESGTAIYLDGRIQLRKPALVFTGRTQYFHTGGYNSRIYSYERDLLYAFSIPAFYDRGFRYYAQIQGKPARFGNRIKMRAQWWLRWSQSIFGDGHAIGSGNDLVNGHKKSDWKFQVMLGW